MLFRSTIDKDMGNHLHFELYKDGVIVDPAKYFDQTVETKTEGNKKAE